MTVRKACWLGWMWRLGGMWRLTGVGLRARYVERPSLITSPCPMGCGAVGKDWGGLVPSLVPISRGHDRNKYQNRQTIGLGLCGFSFAFSLPLNNYELQKKLLRYFMFAQQFSAENPEALCRHVMGQDSHVEKIKSGWHLSLCLTRPLLPLLDFVQTS